MSRPVHLAFVQNRLQWVQFCSRYGGGAEELVPVTLAFDLAEQWESQGQPFFELWRFVDGVDQQQIRDSACLLAETWFRPLLGDVRHGKLAPAELCKADMIPVFALSAFVERAFGRLLDECRPKRCTVWSNLNKPLSGHIGADNNDVAAAVVLHMAEHRGIETLRLPQCDVDIRSTHRRVTFEHAKDINPGKDLFGPLFAGNRASLVCLQLCNHTDYVVQSALREELERRGLTVISAVYGGGTSDTAAGRLRFEPFLDLPFLLGDLQRSVVEARRRFVEDQSSYSGLHAESLGNPYLNFQFQDFFDTLIAGARWFEAAGALADMVGPQVCLTGIDVTGLRRCGFEAFLVRNIPTVQHHHGLICEFELHDFRSNFLFVPGTIHRDEHIARGRAPERIVVAGDVGLGDADRKPRVQARSSAAPATRILVLSASASVGNDHVPHDGRRHRLAWRSLIDFVDSRPGVELLIKSHPRYDDFAFYQNLSKRSSAVRLMDRNSQLDECLNLADIVVMVSSMTSAVINAMEQQKPVIYVVSAQYVSGSDSNTKLLCKSGAGVVSELEELPAVFGRLLDDPAARRQVVERQNEFLRDFVCYRGQAAACRMADFVVQLAGKGCVIPTSPDAASARLAWRYIAEGSPEEFREGLLQSLTAAPRNGLASREKTAERLLAWLSLWTWQFTSHSDRNLLIRAVGVMEDELDLGRSYCRRLEASLYRAEALRCKAMGETSGMRRNALRAIFRQNPLRHNLDLSHMVLESVFGGVPQPVVRWVKGMLKRETP